jgi:hypothetical protein
MSALDKLYTMTTAADGTTIVIPPQCKPPKPKRKPRHHRKLYVPRKKIQSLRPNTTTGGLSVVVPLRYIESWPLLFPHLIDQETIPVYVTDSETE